MDNSISPSTPPTTGFSVNPPCRERESVMSGDANSSVDHSPWAITYCLLLVNDSVVLILIDFQHLIRLQLVGLFSPCSDLSLDA